MNKKIFEGSTIEECLENAANTLNVKKKNLTYEVIEEKKGFFKKKCIIEVEVLKKSVSVDGKIKINNEKIEIIDPKENGKPAEIVNSDVVKVFIDGKEIKEKTQVFEKNNITFEIPKKEAKRMLNISVTHDNIEAHIDIRYIPKVIYGLKDEDYTNIYIPKIEEKEKIYPPHFSKEEIKRFVKQKNICYGIIEENINKCLKENNIEDLVIAKGEKAVDDEEDTVEIKFNDKRSQQDYNEEINKKIDYKNIGFIKAVNEGEVLAVKFDGKQGKNGINVYGKTLKRKIAKKINIKSDEGCKIENNQVIATISGKPSVKNYKFTVKKLYELNSDVDMKTGNIKFIGDVIVHGNVLEGMEVQSDSNIEIYQNIEGAKIIGKENVIIHKNAILSKISAGEENVKILEDRENLLLLQSHLQELIMAFKQIKQYKLVEESIPDGQILKMLIEKKFRIITKLSQILMESDFIEQEIKFLIKQKLIGIAPLSIRYYTEIYVIIKLIEKKINEINSILFSPSNVRVSYCQECDIKSSGDTIIDGKGEYVSRISANRNVIFIDDNSIALGGTIEAKNSIKCGIVGSKGGVSTELKVGSKGNIKAKLCYQNTTFIIGKRKKRLEKSSENIYAYLDKEGEITIDTLTV